MRFKRLGQERDGKERGGKGLQGKGYDGSKGKVGGKGKAGGTYDLDIIGSSWSGDWGGDDRGESFYGQEFATGYLMSLSRPDGEEACRFVEPVWAD